MDGPPPFPYHDRPIQGEGEVVYLVAHKLEELPDERSSGEDADGSDSRVDAITVRTRDFR